MRNIPWKNYFNRSVLYGIFFFLVLFSILYINTFHEKYPDEFDNILGGKLIVNGIFPYSGFFSHHGPVAYLLSAALSLFSGGSFVGFRIVYCVFLSFYLIGSYWYIRKSVGVSQSKAYLVFLPLLGISMTYFWGHMFVADSLAALFLLPVIALFLLKTIYEKKLTTLDLVIVSFLCFAAVMSALTYIYAVMFLYLFAFYRYGMNHLHKGIIIAFGKPIVVFALPFIFFVCYLFITGSIQDYYWQAIDYNQKYYIYNYPHAAGSTTINPVRFGVIMVHNFYNNFYPLLHQVRDFNFDTPFNITLALAVTSLTIYLFIKRHFAAGFLLLCFIIFANARSSPIDSGEKDYQSAVYIVIALLSMCIVFSVLWEELKNTSIVYTHKIIFSLLLFLVGIYSFFLVGFIFNSFFDKVFNKYMGTAPLIYDRPELGPILNKIVHKDEYVWVGPYEYEELIYVQGRPASKYHVLLPGMGKSEKIQTEFIADLEKNKPNVIWFDKTFFILGQSAPSYAPRFIQYLDDNYETLYTYRDNGVRYLSTLPHHEKIDIEGKLYIRKDKMQVIIDRLTAENLIQKENK